jgi:UDP-N-acetylmuramoyl-tripeptide--D-alanyl-D-alanine ligase
MKKIAKKAVAAVLGYQVRKLVKKNKIKVIAVVGSIGKTSTKLAIANVLKAGFRVRYQEGNYNDLVSVPLIFFDEKIPSLFNPFAWLSVFWRNRKKLGDNYPYDIVIVELGSDGPGQIQEFKKYLNLEIGVITAITPEHMQFFKNLDEVAKEELAVTDFSSLVLANKDLCDAKYLSGISQLLAYTAKQSAEFNITSKSRAELYSISAAVVVAAKLGMQPTDIKKGLANVKAIPGRMNELAGTNGSTIIDDSYNSSPAAVQLALDYLYGLSSPQKIAVLGSMNELGAYSKQAHEEAGCYCDPKQLALVVTIGKEANEYLAAAANDKGCKVQSFDSPYTAGEYLKPILKKDAAVLIKGSQNGVFAEETVKILLAKPSDSQKLVRQTDDWLKIKSKAFST